MQTVSVLTCAWCAADVYESSAKALPLHLRSQGWQRLSQHITRNNEFFARTYIKKDISNTVIIAYRGTVLNKWLNLTNDLEIALKRTPSFTGQTLQYYLKSCALLTELRPLAQNKNLRFILTGHSLGGALAQWLAVKINLPTVAFNSPGIGNLPGINAAKTYPNILNVNALDDGIHLVGKAIGRSVSCYVPQGEHLLAASIIEEKAADKIIFNLPEKVWDTDVAACDLFQSLAKQHQIDNLIAALSGSAKAIGNLRI